MYLKAFAVIINWGEKAHSECGCHHSIGWAPAVNETDDLFSWHPHCCHRRSHPHYHASLTMMDCLLLYCEPFFPWVALSQVFDHKWWESNTHAVIIITGFYKKNLRLGGLNNKHGFFSQFWGWSYKIIVSFLVENFLLIYRKQVYRSLLIQTVALLLY